MPGMLKAATSQLLIIDVQEKLLPAIDGAQRVVDGCSKLLTAAGELNLPITISEQYPKGLGHTVTPLMAEAGTAHIADKVHFSCLKDPHINAHLNSLKKEGRSQIILGGIESHICVLQTALDLIEAGFDTYVVSDAVGSRNSHSQDLAEMRLREAGASIITVEMALFEWLEKAGTENFKTLSGLIK